jgi:hypothetical protein
MDQGLLLPLLSKTACEEEHSKEPSRILSSSAVAQNQKRPGVFTHGAFLYLVAGTGFEPVTFRL